MCLHNPYRIRAIPSQSRIQSSEEKSQNQRVEKNLRPTISLDAERGSASDGAPPVPVGSGHLSSTYATSFFLETVNELSMKQRKGQRPV